MVNKYVFIDVVRPAVGGFRCDFDGRRLLICEKRVFIEGRIFDLYALVYKMGDTRIWMREKVDAENTTGKKNNKQPPEIIFNHTSQEQIYMQNDVESRSTSIIYKQYIYVVLSHFFLLEATLDLYIQSELCIFMKNYKHENTAQSSNFKMMKNDLEIIWARF